MGTSSEGLPPSFSVDSREPRAYLTNLQHAAGDQTSIAVYQMPFGDYGWPAPDTGMVLVERKTVRDFMHSIEDGRWAKQIAGLVSSSPLPILLLEGSYEYDAGGGHIVVNHHTEAWSPDFLDGALLTAQRQGLYVSHCPFGPRAVAHRLLRLREWSLRQTHNTLTPRNREVYSAHPAEQVALAMLCMFPGVGQKTARAWLDKWGSVTGVISALSRGDVPGKLGGELRALVEGGFCHG